MAWKWLGAAWLQISPTYANILRSKSTRSGHLTTGMLGEFLPFETFWLTVFFRKFPPSTLVFVWHLISSHHDYSNLANGLLQELKNAQSNLGTTGATFFVGKAPLIEATLTSKDMTAIWRESETSLASAGINLTIRPTPPHQVSSRRLIPRQCYQVRPVCTFKRVNCAINLLGATTRLPYRMWV